MVGYAVVEIGGKQHRVSVGEKLRVDLMAERKVGESFSLNNVMMVGGDSYKVGKPNVAGAMVNCTVTAGGNGEGIKGEKLFVFKKKRRKGFEKTIGHRQKYTEISIDSING
ncbi:MAG TPA: 50S ribosomal protein L21 [Myxococcota bacterium]|nr:50S ribosomal protein L21 [Myxococcota bacterium]